MPIKYVLLNYVIDFLYNKL